MASLTSQFVDSHVGKIQVRLGGAGDPLVYLHSATGEGEGLSMLEGLADNFQVIAPMFPGFGESEGIDQIDDMEDATFHLIDLLESLGVVAPAYVGLSLGGWMAAEVATRYPERVGRLVLINPAGLYIDGAEIKDIFGRTPDVMADDLFADHEHPMYQMMKAFGALDPSAISFDLVKPIYQTMAATARLAWDPYLHNPKLRGRLRRVTAPTLVIRSDEDTLIPVAHAEAYAAEIPGARLEHVPGAAHLAPLEKADELAAVITQFLRS